MTSMDTFNLVVGIVSLISGSITVYQTLKHWRSLGKWLKKAFLFAYNILHKLLKAAFFFVYDILYVLDQRPPIKALLILARWFIFYGCIFLGVLMAMLGTAGHLPIELCLLSFLFMYLMGESGFVLFKYEPLPNRHKFLS